MTVPRASSSAAASMSSEHNMNGQVTACSLSDRMNENVEMNVNSDNSCNRPPIANSGLSSTELPLPLFDENLEVNPMFHLKQLNEFIKLKGIPQARKSAVGCLCRRWLEAISDKLKNYEDFRQAFLSTWWSSSHQILVKHSIYQAKYDRRTGLTLSGHFLKYATWHPICSPDHLTPK
jgi:hypothetical protein